MHKKIDANNDGKVTWEEFRARLQPPFDVTNFLRSVFSQVSANENGAVSKEELTKVFEHALDCSDMTSKKTFRTLVQEAGLSSDFYTFEQPDASGGEGITWDEFEGSLKVAGVGEEAEDSACSISGTLPSAKADVVVEEKGEKESGRCWCG